MINFIILSCTKDNKSFNITNDLLKSLKNTIYPVNNNFLQSYRILIIESGNYDNKYDNCIYIKYDFKKYNVFNYNYALNIGIDYCYNNYKENDWFCFLNNDVIVDKNWILEINNALNKNKSIQSICPNIGNYKDEIIYGYTLGKHLDGCCFICSSNTIDKIGLFDEQFNFYFQDDDYLEQLRIHNILHAKVMSSKITHIGQQTMPTNYQLLFYGRDVFIKKYSIQTYLEREKEKQMERQ